MNDLPRHTLSRIIREHGRAICDTPKRVEALLRDLCGAHRREINIIIGALEERVAADLLAARGTVPREALLARLAARLRDNLAYTPEAARWGVETWAVALGTISEAELRERVHAESAEDGRGDATPDAPRAETPAANSPRVAPPVSQPSRGTTHAPPQQSPQSPQPVRPPQSPKVSRPPQTPTAGRPPTIVTPPARAPRQMPATHPKTHAPRPPQQNVVPPPARDASRRGLTLRGCLIGVVLIIVLIVAAVFVVPAVIMILKEEQAQPSINDPRIG
ncbi:MAG TPA: hypothetical protein VEY11_14080 [Pyrinomonadaceae bacterium]|nr:hypothetical protein [Pyrinomonadaceae bacterium]